MNDEKKSGGSCMWMFFIWGSPTIVVPLIILLLMGVWPIGVALALFFLFWMGRLQAAGFDANPDNNAPKWGKVVLYMVAQIILIPLVLYGILLGLCSFTGSGTFK